MTKKTLKAVLKSLNKKYGDVFHLGQVQSGEEIQGEIVIDQSDVITDAISDFDKLECE